MEKLYTQLITKSTSKSIIIDGALHAKFKMFCKGKNMKIGAVIEDLIILYLNNYKTLQKMIEESKDDK